MVEIADVRAAADEVNRSKVKYFLIIIDEKVLYVFIIDKKTQMI